MENLKTDPETVSTVEAAEPPESSVGTVLRLAREGAGVSRQDLAKRLKLSVSQLESLEEDRWEKLPGQTFIRGFVRNYARQFELDAAPLMTRLDSLLKPASDVLDLPSPTQEQITFPSAASRDRSVAFAGITLACLAGLLYFLLPNDLQSWRDSAQAFIDNLSRQDSPSTEPAANEAVFPPGATAQQVLTPQAQTPAEIAPPVVSEEKPLPVTPLSTTPSTPAPTPASSAAAAPAPVVPAAPTPATATPVAPTAAPTGSAKQSTLDFTADKVTWVEVKGRDGRVIFSQRMAAGSSQSVSGEGPLTLVIGYAPGLRLNWRGQAVDLAPHTRGDVARLVLE